ncbi:Riboflavin biosynthesis protein RibBA [Geobacillus sp. BCO2]|nr:Riboflavin biosynthesis protein RibBA [Geobacillus sp. BCO2]
MFDTIEAALSALKNGEVIIVCDDEDRENEAILSCWPKKRRRMSLTL